MMKMITLTKIERMRMKKMNDDKKQNMIEVAVKMKNIDEGDDEHKQ